jgi:hypothetical protein
LRKPSAGFLQLTSIVQFSDLILEFNRIGHEPKERFMRRRAGNLLKSVLKTAVYLLEESGDTANDVRDRVAQGVDRASDRLSDLRDRGRDFYTGENRALRSALMFGAGIAVGVGAGLLLAPASGEETRDAIGDKVEEFRGQVRDRFSPARSATGTEGN